MGLSPLDIVAVQTLIGAGLLGGSLWWYRRTPYEGSGHAGRVLWVVWIVFLVLSLGILAVIGLDALLLGGAVTWAFCVAGTVLSSRLLVRAYRNREQDIWALTLVFALGSALLGSFFPMFTVSQVLRS